MSDLRFYTVSTEYLNHLKEVEPKVYYATGATYINAKPYIGIILEISGHKFIAPLTSYKPKQDKIKSSSFAAFKLHERGNPDNKLGMVSLNNMIPIIDSEIIPLDLQAQSSGYRRMLYKQFEFIKANSEEIKDRAAKLHHQVTVVRTPFYVGLSCDFNEMIDASRTFGT